MNRRSFLRFMPGLPFIPHVISRARQPMYKALYWLEKDHGGGWMDLSMVVRTPAGHHVQIHKHAHGVAYGRPWYEAHLRLRQALKAEVDYLNRYGVRPTP